MGGESVTTLPPWPLIYEVSDEGTMVKQFGSSSEKGTACLCGPSLCAVDSKGQLLVADKGHMQYKLVSTETASIQWSSLSIVTQNAYDVKVESNGCTLWCSQYSRGNYVLKKYELCI